MSAVAETSPSAADDAAAVAAARRSIRLQGYDVTYVGGPTPGAGKYRVKNARREYSPSFFTREELIALAACNTRSTFLATLDAAKVVNRYVTAEEINAMSKKASKKKKPAAEAGEPILKPSERKRASKKAAAPPDVPTEAPAAEGSSKKGASKKAARVTKVKEPKEPREAAGASVPGSTPELLTYLAQFQDDTIERMNGLRVVELAVAVMGATVDNPVTRKSLTVYPQRIAREMVRLGIFRQESVDGVGLCYFAANGLKKLANKQQQ
jgi:hypothetical protein